MNTVMELTAMVNSGQPGAGPGYGEDLPAGASALRYRREQRHSAINHGEGAWVPVSQETFQLLSLALSYGRETQGALDITAYSAVHAWGFTTGEYRVPGPEELAGAGRRIDYTRWSWTGGLRVRLPQGCSWIWVHRQGGPAICWRSWPAGNPPSSIWAATCGPQGTSRTALPGALASKPRRRGAPATWGSWSSRSQAVITSGGYERYFEEDGQTYWHIMDPETAAPARSGLKSVTIVSPLGVYCDALSTAVFVRGADWGADFWRTHQDFEMVLVLEDGSLWVTAGLAGSFTLAEDYQDLEVTVIQL